MAKPKREKRDEPTSNAMSPDEQITLTLEARRFKREMESINGKYRAVLKKLDAGGVNLKAWQQVEKLRKMDDDERELLLRDVNRYAGFINLPLGAQAAMFSDDTPQPGEKARTEYNEAVVEDAGYASGLEGAGADLNPHEPGSPVSALWEKGRVNGAAAMTAKMATGEGATTGGRKPGRRRAANDAAA